MVRSSKKGFTLILLFTLLSACGAIMAFRPVPKQQITVKLEGTNDATVYLAHYFGNKVLRIDSMRTDLNGQGAFTRTDPWKPGIYLVYMNDKNYFEFLLGSDQQFSINASFDKNDQIRFTGADETQAFQQYKLYLAAQQDKQAQLQKSLANHAQNPDSTSLIRKQLLSLNDEVEKYWSDHATKYKGTFFADFLNAMIIPRQPDPIIPENHANPDSVKWILRYNFLRDHYWDNFNFSQPGLIRTPVLESKLEGYFKKTLLQIPDSIIRPALTVVEKSKVSEEMYQYILLYLLNETNQSEIMGMDKAFVALSEKYVLNNQANWLDSATQAKIRDKVAVTKPNLIGNLAPDLKLPDSEGNYFSLRQMNSPYTLLYFWEPDCSHCQKSTPQLFKELYLPLKDKGIDIYAVCTQNDKEKWLSAIQKYGIHEWTNVWDPGLASRFRQLYDITSTPVIYILDKEKKIIAKRIDVETAVKFLNSLTAAN